MRRVRNARDLDARVPFHAHMYADNAAYTVVIAAGNTWTTVEGGLSVDHAYGFTFQSSKQLRCDAPGLYLISWSMAIESTGANDDIEGTIAINGTASSVTTCHMEMPTPNMEGCFGAHAILRLAGGDVVQFALNNNTDADDILLQHASMTLLRISE